MVVDSILPHAESGPNDHRKDAPPLTTNVLGGGSACLSLPIDGISPNEKMEFIKYLTRQGATIEELNSIRSQISKVKGGKLLEAARKANFIHTFILSGKDSILVTFLVAKMMTLCHQHH